MPDEELKDDLTAESAWPDKSHRNTVQYSRHEDDDEDSAAELSSDDEQDEAAESDDNM